MWSFPSLSFSHTLLLYLYNIYVCTCVRGGRRQQIQRGLDMARSSDSSLLSAQIKRAKETKQRTEERKQEKLPRALMFVREHTCVGTIDEITVVFFRRKLRRRMTSGCEKVQRTKERSDLTSGKRGKKIGLCFLSESSKREKKEAIAHNKIAVHANHFKELSTDKSIGSSLKNLHTLLFTSFWNCVCVCGTFDAYAL